MATFTRKERQKQRVAGDVGAIGGGIAGVAAGAGGVSAGQKLNRSRGALKGFRNASRAAGNGRLKSLATAARVAPAALKGPKTRMGDNPLSGGMGRFVGGYVGGVTGLVAGNAAADGAVKRKQMKNKVKKNDSTSAFGVDHG